MDRKERFQYDWKKFVKDNEGILKEILDVPPHKNCEYCNGTGIAKEFGNVKDKCSCTIGRWNVWDNERKQANMMMKKAALHLGCSVNMNTWNSICKVFEKLYGFGYCKSK